MSEFEHAYIPQGSRHGDGWGLEKFWQVAFPKDGYKMEPVQRSEDEWVEGVRIRYHNYRFSTKEGTEKFWEGRVGRWNS